MDGLGGPGLFTRLPLTLYHAPSFTGPRGQTLPGANVLTTLSAFAHLAYTPPFRVLGGYLGLELLIPFVFAHLTTSGARESTTGVGDVIFSPLVFQGPNLKILGRPFYHRADLDVVIPTGQYSPNALVSIGSHVWSFNPYYAFTWLPSDRLETSWRIHYLWNSVNADPGSGYKATTIQPGQAIHFNGALSFEAIRPLRTGVAGYFLQQISDSRASGRPVPGSRERVAALGPGIFAMIGSTELIANAYWEFAVENRPSGARLNLVACRVW